MKIPETEDFDAKTDSIHFLSAGQVCITRVRSNDVVSHQIIQLDLTNHVHEGLGLSGVSIKNYQQAIKNMQLVYNLKDSLPKDTRIYIRVVDKDDKLYQSVLENFEMISTENSKLNQDYYLAGSTWKEDGKLELIL